ncbi:TIR domain-containing protein [Lysobacter ciconiae]|uniref:TIR domain-containing protein n=1 Tax=Novilysobacter ciconiae TaxID=2781022 RepID=A0A7S6ZR96_9GAMM|nr:TIR domain-containing protein [Lysobacter ciconiae]
MVLKVFLNHCAEDKALVTPYFNKLKALGFEPWIDKRILPGQDWDEVIQHAFNAADVYLIFMTPRSVSKRGYVQREISDALDKQRYNLPGDIGLIPILLEDCEVPVKILRSHQYIRLPEGWQELVESLELAAQQRSIAIHTGVEMDPFRMFLREEKHRWEGLPGYEVSMRYPHVESSRVPNTAVELNEFFASLRLNSLLNARKARINQEEEHFSSWAGDPDWKPANSFHVFISPNLANQFILSFSVHEDGMFAGAAHGFMWVETHNFMIIDDQLIKISFDDFLSEPHSAYTSITALVRERVAKEYAGRFDGELSSDDLIRVREALPSDGTIFRNFIITPIGITFLYPQGELFGHAAGAFGADLSFNDLRPWLKPGGPHTFAQHASAISWDPGIDDEVHE